MVVRRHLIALLAVFSLIVGFTVSSASVASAEVPPATAPDAPTSLVAYRGYSSAEIAFTAGADGGAAITNYEFSTDNGSSWTAFSPAVTSSPVTIGGLTNGSTYSVKLRAANSVGAGTVSDAVSVTPAVVDARTWTARTAAEANSWTSVTYGNGVFVAVASHGSSRVMTSTDGVTWTARTSAEANNWNSVAFGNGLFVAVAASGTNRVMTSTDGVTWTAHSAVESDWISVTYGNGVFVAVAVDGASRVMTSTDGVTWTARTAAEESGWVSVTYGNGVFVAVASSGTSQVMTSTDGETWTARTAAEESGWISVTYGNGVFVAVAIGGASRVMTSADGETWTARNAAEANPWRSVAYGNGVFVAVAITGSNRVMTSPDGVTWTARTAAEANFWRGVTYGNGRFVAVSQNGTNRVMTSSLGELATAPVAPTVLIATPGSGSASIAFTAGADGGASITKYQYKVGTGSWTDAVGTSSPITISGLTNYQTANVRLRAVNVEGNSPASSSVSVTPRQAGPAVTSATPSGRTGIVVTFSLNPLPGTTVAYQSVVAYARGTNTVRGTCRTYARQTTCFIGGLTRATNYDLRVTAHLPVPGKTWHNTTAAGSILQVSTNN